jgi:hypothetical protein
MRFRQFFLGSFGALALASCSLINHFDSLNPVPPDAGAGTGGSSGDDSVGGSSAGDSTVGGKGGTVGAGGMAGSTTIAGTGGGAGTGGAAPLPDGLVLVAGTVGGKVNANPPGVAVISVLSPYTGAELHRIKAPLKFEVAALVYDGIADLWYAIYQNAFNPFSEPARLSILSVGLDGTVMELSNTQVPVPISNFLIAPLRGRLLYVAYTADTPPKTIFALISTKEPKLPLQLSGSNPVYVPAEVDPVMSLNPLIGMLGRANTSETALGGTVSLITQAAYASAFCTGNSPPMGTPANACPVRVFGGSIDAVAPGPTLDSVGTDGTYPLVGYVSSTANGAAGWAIEKGNGGGSDVFILPPLDFATDDTARMLELSPFSHTVQNTYTFPMKGPHVSNAAFDSCSGIGFAGELNVARTLYAVPTAAMGVPSVTAISQTVNLIAFEPFTRTLIRAFQDATTPSIDAWNLLGTDAAPTLKARPATGKNAWAPPADVNPAFIVVKDPPVPPCN